MIRKIREDDIVKVMSLWMKGNLKYHNFIDKDYWLEIFNNKKEELLNTDTFVYIENEKILGFISLNNQNVTDIYVDNNLLRTGIGTKLINYCKDLKENLEVTIFEKNIKAILFFSSLDFKNMGIHINEKFNEKEYILKW